MTENACALARDVVEEWTLLEALPPREVLVVRAEYAVHGAACLALPAVLAGRANVEARAVGHGTGALTLGLEAGPSRSQRVVAMVPRGVSPARPLRVEFRSTGAVAPVRWFRAAWPPLGADAREPRRRTATLPYGFVFDMPRAWTCQSETPEVADGVGRPVSPLFCVSTDPAPAPFALRLRAAPVAPGSAGLAAALVLAALAVLVRVARVPLVRSLPAVLGGAFAGAAVALALAASHTLTPLVAGVACVLAGASLGALASQRPASRTVGGIALLAVSTLALLDGRAGLVLALSASATLALLCARALDHRSATESAVEPRPPGA